MITYGTESIQKQTNNLYILELNALVNELQETTNKTLLYKDISLNDTNTSYENYDKYSRLIKNSIYDSSFTKMSNILSERFGIKITVDAKKMKDSRITSLIMPNLNYRTVNVALNSMDELFPKRKEDSVLWSTQSSYKENILHKTLTDITEALKSDGFTLDLKNARISGLTGSEFNISLDVLTTTLVSMTAEEVVSLMLFEVGKIFTYLEYMHTTTKTNFTLIDTFLNEKFDKNTEAIDSLSIAVGKANGGVHKKEGSVAVLNELEVLMLKTYRIDGNTNSVRIDFNQLSDMFVARFGLGDVFAKALIKQKYNKLIIQNSEDDTSSQFVKVIMMIIGIMAFIMSYLIMSTLGLLVFVIYVSVKLLSYLIGYIIKSILSIFIATISTGTNTTIKFDNMGRRLVKLRLELIRELRKSDKTSNSDILIDKIDNIKEVIDNLKKSITTIASDKYFGNEAVDYSTGKTLEDYLEEMEENELHLYGAKFKNLK